jgi:hypothetical protein
MPPTSASIPATITTNETFPATAATARLDREVDLRLRAGAIRCTYRRQGEKWIMKTEWNVIGGNG